MFLNPDKEDLIYGIVYFLISAPQVPFYVLVILAVQLKQKSSPNVTYRLVNCINYCHGAQSVGHNLTSMLMIFPQLQIEYPIIVRIIGSLFIALFSAGLAFMAILAVIRVLIYSKNVANWKISRAVNVAIVVIIISLSPPTAYFATSGAFAFKPPGWFFDNQAPYASIFNNCAFAGFMISLGISYISYITIVVLIIATKRHMSVSNRKEEISILLPYTIVILYISGGLVYWYAVTENVDLSNRTSQVIANIVWVTGGYWTPTFLVVFHRSIRSGIWNSADGMLCGMKSTNIANVFYVG